MEEQYRLYPSERVWYEGCFKGLRGPLHPTTFVGERGEERKGSIITNKGITRSICIISVDIVYVQMLKGHKRTRYVIDKVYASWETNCLNRQSFVLSSFLSTIHTLSLPTTNHYRQIANIMAGTHSMPRFLYICILHILQFSITTRSLLHYLLILSCLFKRVSISLGLIASRTCRRRMRSAGVSLHSHCVIVKIVGCVKSDRGREIRKTSSFPLWNARSIEVWTETVVSCSLGFTVVLTGFEIWLRRLLCKIACKWTILRIDACALIFSKILLKSLLMYPLHMEAASTSFHLRHALFVCAWPSPFV